MHAAAFRRGRHWPSHCVPEAVVLSLPCDDKHGTESTAGLPCWSHGSSVNDLGPRLEVGPARPPVGSNFANAHPIMNLTLVYRGGAR